MTTPTYPSFDDIPGLHSALAANIRAQKFASMTEIQHKTWPQASQGVDVLARARTGTGKVSDGLIY